MQELNLKQTEEVAGGVIVADDLLILGAVFVVGVAVGYIVGSSKK